MSETLEEKPKKPLTPMKAIREYCVWCCGDDRFEVKRCPSIGCDLYGYRMGVSKRNLGGRMKAIRKRCIDCVGGEIGRINDCPIPDCHLYVYRMGTNPVQAEAQIKRGSPEHLKKFHFKKKKDKNDPKEGGNDDNQDK